MDHNLHRPDRSGSSVTITAAKSTSLSFDTIIQRTSDITSQSASFNTSATFDTIIQRTTGTAATIQITVSGASATTLGGVSLTNGKSHNYIGKVTLIK